MFKFSVKVDVKFDVAKSLKWAAAILCILI